MASANYYQTLHIKPDASQAEIAAAYRRLARLVHPDLNPAPDAHRQMQALNEAYNTLRHPERRRRYDAAQATPAAAGPAPAATTATARPAPAGPRPANLAAWLSYQKRVGDQIVFTIGHADNMAALLADLQRRIPPADRHYEIAHNRWRVAVEHEGVLRTLFRNYAPVVQGAPPRRTAPPSAHTFRARDGRARDGRARDGRAPARQRRAWLGMGSAVAAALLVYAMIFGQVVLPELALAPAAAAPAVDVAPQTRATTSRPMRLAVGEEEAGRTTPGDDEAPLVFPADCAPARLATAPAYFREACATLDQTAHTAASARPFALTTTRVASNIRSGPDTRFPILTTTPAGGRVQLVGYTVSRGYVWFLTNFGGWIRSDLLRDAPVYLPKVAAGGLNED